MRIYFFLSKSSPNSYHETTNKKLDQFLGSYLTMSWDFVIIKFNNQIFPRNILVWKMRIKNQFQILEEGVIDYLNICDTLRGMEEYYI